MSRKSEIINSANSNIYSIEEYPTGFMDSFNPNREYTKWAALEVSDIKDLAKSMKSFESPAGLYAVFIHKGTAQEGVKVYQKIFHEWLPSSDFILDDRPHFAIMKSDYRPDDPYAEEEILIPVKEK